MVPRDDVPIFQAEYKLEKVVMLRTVFAVAILISSSLLLGAETGAPTEVRAADVLPPKLLKSPVHSIRELKLERFWFQFEVESPFGIYKPTSIEMLKVRVAELQVLAGAKDISGLEEFADSLKDSVVQVPVGVIDTVFNPVSSVKQVGAGVKDKFTSAGRLFAGREKSTYEDNTLKEASLGAQKRLIAAELGFDVYSTNPKVQQLLNHLARARAMGAAPVRLAGMAAPPGVGLALTIIRLRKDVNEDLKRRSPGELHSINSSILKKLGISEDARDALLENRFYSPRHKTVICADLEAMKNVKGLENFLLTTLDDSSEDDALFTERQADMLLYYHKRISRIAFIERSGRLPIAITESGSLVVLAPADLLYVNERAVEILRDLKSVSGETNVRDRKIVISGTATDGFKEAAAKDGFEVTEHFLDGAGN
jgi:hypothetical protein